MLRKATGITAAPERGITARAASAGRFFGAGVLSAGAVIPAFAEAAGDVLGLPSLTEWGRSRGQAVQHEIESLRKAPGAGETEQAVLSGVESMGLAIPTLAIAAAGGGEAAALGIFGAVSGSGAYRRAREQGLEPTQALVYAAEQGLTEALTERIPASRLLKDLGGRTGLRRMLTRQLAAEIPGEQVATAVQDLTDWAHLNPERPFSEYLAERPGAIYQTAVATVIGTLGQTGALAGVNRLTQPSAAAQEPPGAPPAPNDVVAGPPPPSVRLST